MTNEQLQELLQEMDDIACEIISLNPEGLDLKNLEDKFSRYVEIVHKIPPSNLFSGVMRSVTLKDLNALYGKELKILKRIGSGGIVLGENTKSLLGNIKATIQSDINVIFGSHNFRPKRK
ncbi:MAG: hypothetical protein ACOYMA_12725 [Bacteroidia bacterium]